MTPWQSSDGFVGFSTELDVPATWPSSAQTIEFVWPIVIANWIEPRCCVRSIEGRNITLADPCGALLIKRNVYAKTLAPPVRIEAVPTKTPSPGSFYHDVPTGELFYTLQSDETVSDLEARSFTTAMESLLVISNTSQHSWINVSFQTSTWFQPNTATGYVDTQSCVYAFDNTGKAAEPPAAVTISLSSDIEISGCTFSAIGSPYALLAGSSSHRINIAQSFFYDLSGGAVRELHRCVSCACCRFVISSLLFSGLGNVLGQHDDETDGSLTLHNNFMKDGGKQYAACAAVFAGYVFNSQITSNTITDFACKQLRRSMHAACAVSRADRPFADSSISVGWGWGGTKFLGYGNNTVSFNRMKRVMTKLRDGGGIYVNGWTNPSYRNTVLLFSHCNPHSRNTIPDELQLVRL
jgi:hypothetical protein